MEAQQPIINPLTDQLGNKKSSLTLILVSLIIILLGTTTYFAFQYSQLKKNATKVEPSATVVPEPTATMSKASPTTTTKNETTIPNDWKTSHSQDNFATFRYPTELNNLISSKQFNLSTKSQQEITNEYEKFKETGCPSTCGKFVDDPSLLQKQFDILNKVKNSPGCKLSAADKEDIRENFMLFTGGIGGKYQVETIETNDGYCGLKIIESDGFDVSLNNFYYKVGFVVGDKIINVNISIFPFNTSEKVDALWENIGFNLTDLSCDASCSQKESEYFENFSINNEVEKEMISAYDQIISTFTFTD